MMTPAKINLGAINREDFRVSEREHSVFGPVVLITPGFDKHAWGLDEVHLRSLLCRPDGTVLSSGFPKFFNYGENEEDTKKINKMIADPVSLVSYTEKLDGSLVIRDVIDGRVHMRTRGSHQLGEGFEAAWKLAEEKYPNLLNPKVGDPIMSYLFEYTSPDNQIILKYDESRLTFLGMVSKETLMMYGGREHVLESIASDFGTPYVQFHDMPQDFDEATKLIQGWGESEGVVLRLRPNTDSLQRVWMTKIKAEKYIRLHSLKFYLTTDKLKQFCWIKGIDTEQKLRDEMFSVGIDWEAVEFCLPAFHEYLEHKEMVEKKSAEFLQLIADEKVADLPSRKDVAVKLNELADGDRQMFNIGIRRCLGEEDKVEKLIVASTLGISVGALENFYAEAEELVKGLEQ